MEVRRISVSIRGLGKGIIKASGLYAVCRTVGGEPYGQARQL